MTQPSSHAPSWYSATAPVTPPRPSLAGEVRADVAIIGAGLTGLGAALTLAERGYRVVVLEAERVGWGASGRNGGQIHPGLRRDPDWLAARFGEAPTRRLLALAEEARLWQRELVARYHIDCDLSDGLIEAVHKRRYVDPTRAWAERLATKWGESEIAWLDPDETEAALGTGAYFGAVRRGIGGHLHPLKFALGLWHAAEAAGATLFEESPAVAIRHGTPVRVETARGAVVAETVVLAGNGYLRGLDPAVDARVMPLNNYILTTAPLRQDLIPGREAVYDTRFVVYYWRMTADRRLLFGGGETYRRSFPADIAGFVKRHMRRVYPSLGDVAVEYAWGGTLGITVNRMPYVRRPQPNVWVAAGYSGQGVMLAPFAGRILGEAVAGQLERFDAFANLPSSPFPGGSWLRYPTLVAAMSWFALRDRL